MPASSRQRVRSCVVKLPQPHWFFSSSNTCSQSARSRYSRPSVRISLSSEVTRAAYSQTSKSGPISVNRGRDARYWAPPAQNRTSGIPAYGSHLGCLTRKRSDGHGWRILGGGSHSRARLSILFHVVTSFWLRRRSERRQRSTTLKRNALSTRMLVGTAW